MYSRYLKSWLRFSKLKLMLWIITAHVALAIIMISIYKGEIIYTTYAKEDRKFRHNLKLHNIGNLKYGKNNQLHTCIIPEYNPFDEQVREFYQPMKELRCIGKPSFIQSNRDNIITINSEISKKYMPENIIKYCFYWAILRSSESERHPDDKVKFLERPNSKFVYNASISDEFIKVVCYDSKENVLFEDFLHFIIKKPSVEDRCTKTENKNNLNVLVFGIDSISRLNFHRHFPKTIEFLNKIRAVELSSYNKVGEGTLDNMIPLLTGKHLKNVWNETSPSTFDHIDLLWKKYSRKGYRSLFMEDAPDWGMFNYEKKGFVNPPADYYIRPFATALETSNRRGESTHHCIGDRMEFEFFLDWGAKFMEKFKEDKYFAFIFLTRIAHNVLNYAGFADTPTRNFLEKMFETDGNKLNNTVVVFMSDHGIRYGNIRNTFLGKLEQNTPFMYLIIPEWLKKKYPSLEKNLQLNRRRLTTQFDIHETLMDVLDYPKSLEKLEQRKLKPKPGISLFSEVPLSRTCSGAGIPSEYCSCHQYKQISTNDSDILKSATIVVQIINRKLDKYNGICLELTLSSVMAAYIRTTNEDAFHKLSTEVYQVNFRTEPGKAEFEAVVMYAPNSDKYSVIGDISRINKYGNQSHCIHNRSLKFYCFCR